ncbi:hypothetical protein tb265_24120 [Gemmatimonadetes bacterium T265]|nr:hypothetical protein tb265_24120 [Gemmatimonadetes bacterium T265]
MTDSAAVVPPDELRMHVERALAASYELDREMGRGGMGIVYRARDRRLKRAVAVKILPPELAFRAEIRSRFLREAETAAQLSHPNIVPIYSVDEVDGLVYFVMACIDGDNLGKRIHDRGPLPIPDARRILAEVADALAYAHLRGVVHRDIKPDNILLDGSGDRAMVTDFGIARAIIEGSDSRLTATGMAIGTPAYMSPEQAAGDREIDGRSDLYALGVLGYQMLAGELPFQASSTPALLVKHLSEKPVPVAQRRPDVPRDLADAVMRLLEKNPDDRFATAGELEAALRGRGPVAPASFATTQPPVAPMPPLAPWRERPMRERDDVFREQERRRAEGVPTFDVPAARALVPATDTGDVDPSAPSPDEVARWESARVADFRRKLGWFAIVGSVLLVISIFGNSDFFGFVGLWTVYIAYRYAKLWSDGYSWHDVLRQPRERLFADVAAEWTDDVQALFDPKKRDRVRERARRRALRRAYGGAVGRPGYSGDTDAARAGAPPTAGARPALPADASEGVRQAFADRDEVLRLLDAMPKAERARVADAGPAAQQLAAKVLGLANRVAELDRDATPGAAPALDAEIARLEGEANPLDRGASDERVKRLAYLKRQRRGVVDAARRRDQAVAALENCRVALQNLRLDLVRLRTGGGGTPAQVTTLAERAMVLAREVDGIVGAAGEVARIGAPDSVSAPPPPLGAGGTTPARA